jgi:hypothetical protein
MPEYEVPSPRDAMPVTDEIMASPHSPAATEHTVTLRRQRTRGHRQFQTDRHRRSCHTPRYSKQREYVY